MDQAEPNAKGALSPDAYALPELPEGYTEEELPLCCYRMCNEPAQPLTLVMQNRALLLCAAHGREVWEYLRSVLNLDRAYPHALPSWPEINRSNWRGGCYGDHEWTICGDCGEKRDD